jgi:phosphate transport system permease protein
MTANTPAVDGLQDSAVRRQMAAATSRIRRLKQIDRAAVGVITFGGIAVVLSVVGILVFIAAEALPLFRGARATFVGTVRLAQAPTDRQPAPALFGSDEQGRHLYTTAAGGGIQLFDPGSGAPGMALTSPSLAGSTVTSASRSLSNDFVALGTNDGRAVLLQVRFSPVYDGAATSNKNVELGEGGVAVLDPSRRAISRVSYVQEDERKIVAGQVADDEVVLWWIDGGDERRAVVRPNAGQKVTALAVGRTGTAIAGTDAGMVYHWELTDAATLTDISPVASVPITALAYVIGNHTFIAGTSDGHVSAWFRAPIGQDEALGMVRALTFAPHGAAVTAIAASTRDRSFATADANGNVVLRHQTSGRTLLTLDGTAPVSHLVMTPKSDGLLVVRRAGDIDRYALANPHPEVSWRVLFGKVWYEGYGKPEYVWQSTGATDDFEPKLSLVPLVFGTIKGTVYALLVAIPLAVFGALYASQFVHPSIRARIKPTVEIMAALPSVVMGFVAGLYLAPMVERYLVAVGLLVVILPIFGTSGLLVWNALPGPLRRRVRPGSELLVIVPLLLLGIGFAFWIAPSVENAMFGGDARQWLLTTFGWTYDQRNSLVVGVAMGFAVIPIIFTISEDAFSSVPASLSAASLALGASRWQTAMRVVIPTASPGVFSAIMIGFGRAVGETMIVLMATGNTPVMDWSIFNGFRTLSANIAVEISEAPQGGTLYRTLFLAAALLFAMTFTLNTIAEVVRQRLRERYKAV